MRFQAYTLLLLIFCMVNAQNNSRSKDGILTSYMELKSKLSQSSKFLAMVMIAGQKCENCEKSLAIFQSYKMNMEGYINSYFLDCDKMWEQVFEREHFPICDPSKSKVWPIVQFFKPPQEEYDPIEDENQKRSPEAIQYKDVLSESRLTTYSKNIMPLFAQNVSSQEEIEQQLANKTIQHKVMLFIKENEEIPYYFKALTSHFKYKIHFCVVQSDEELLQSYSIEETPAIIAFRYNRQKENYKQEVYVGPKRIAPAKTFFQKYSSGVEKKDVNTSYNPKSKSKSLNATNIQEFQEIIPKFNPNQGILLYLITEQTNADNFSIESLEQNPKFKSFISQFKTYVDKILIYKYQKNEITTEQEEFFVLNKLSNQEDHLLFYPSGYKNINQFFKVRAKLSKKEMISEIMALMEFKEDILDEEAIQHFIKHAFNNNRMATTLFIDSEDKQAQEITFVYRFLSSQKRFRECLSFGVYKDVSEDNLKYWNIEKLPHIVTFMHGVDNKDSIQTAVYDSAPDFSYLAIHNYLSQICFSKEKEVKESELIVETNTQENFDKQCGNGQECFIAFLDYSRENKFKIDLDIFKTLSENYRNQKGVNWVYIDGRCHKQILKRINLNEQDLPYLVYYNSKKWRYKVMEEGYVFKQMMEFVSRLLKTKRKNKDLIKLSDGFDIDERDCEQLRNRKYDL